MQGVLQPLHDEHAELLPKVERLRTLADGLTDGSAVLTIVPRIDEALEFLQGGLIPHAMAEDEVLYPAVERVMGAPGAMVTMSRDHIEVMRLVEALEAVRKAIPSSGPSTTHILDARRLLYGLYALVGVHFAKEEEFLVPLLETTLDKEGAAHLSEQMDAAAERARPGEEEAAEVIVAG